MPELARHEVGVFGHRAKRVQRCQRPTINDSIDQRSMMPMMDWSTIVIRAARPSPHLPLLVLGNTFSASNFGFKIGLLLNLHFSPPEAQLRPRNASQMDLRTPPFSVFNFKTQISLKTIQLPHENLIFHHSGSCKNHQNSTPNPL